MLLLFKSPLTRVQFRVFASGLLEDRLSLKSISLKGVSSKADFLASPIPHWQNYGPKEELCLYSGRETIPVESPLIIYDAYLIPQQGEIELSLVCDVRTKDAVLHDQELTQSFQISLINGKFVTYTVKVDSLLDLSIGKG